MVDLKRYLVIMCVLVLTSMDLSGQETIQKTNIAPYNHFYLKWVNRQWKIKEEFSVLVSDTTVKHGPYVAYVPNGQTFSKGTFSHNQRVGIWEFYDFNTGTLIEKYDYDKRQVLFYDSKKELMQVKQGEQYTADSVDASPHFPGDRSFFILINARYPQRAVNKKASGAVFVTLLINEKGEISVLDFIPSEELKNTGTAGYYKYEALQAVQELPKYIPAKKGGKPVSVKVEMIPVKFKMPN